MIMGGGKNVCFRRHVFAEFKLGLQEGYSLAKISDYFLSMV